MSGRCKKRVHNDYGVSFHQCTRKAVRDGFCKQHHPEAEDERRRAAEARWRAEEAVRKKEWRLRAAAPDMLEALQRLVSRIEYYSSLRGNERPNIEDWEYTEGSGDMAKARAAIKKATT